MLNESNDFLKHKFNKVIRVAKRFMRHAVCRRTYSQ